MDRISLFEITAPVAQWLRRRPEAVTKLAAIFSGDHGPHCDRDPPREARMGQGSPHTHRILRSEDPCTSGENCLSQGDGAMQPVATQRFALESVYACLVAAITARLLALWQVEGVSPAPEETARAIASVFSVGHQRDKNGADGAPSPLAAFVQWLGLPQSVPMARACEELSPLLMLLVEDLWRLPWNDAARPNAPGDGFRALREALFPKKVRLTRGEFYTPFWLAWWMLGELDYPSGERLNLFDPACGSGVFLVAGAWRRAETWLPREETSRRHAVSKLGGPGPEEILGCFLDGQIVGLDVDPTAVLTARANLLLSAVALSQQAYPDSRIALLDVLRHRPPVIQGDFLSTWALREGRSLAPASSAPVAGEIPLPNQTFDLVVGNPPWIVWDRLTSAQRERMATVFEELGLFDLSPQAARHGGAKRDCGGAFLCATLPLLKSGGRLAMVVPVTLFHSRSAGQSFRRFLTGANPPLRVLRIDDLRSWSIFPGTVRRTAILFLEKGRPTEFPVPVRVWHKPVTTNEAHIFKSSFLNCRFTNSLAQPADPRQPQEPWVFLSPSLRELWPALARPSAYRAYLGANTGGANGVFWLELLERTGRGILVRNCHELGQKSVPAVTAVLEPDLLYPLLRWKDLTENPLPRMCLLMMQNPATRQAWPEADVRQQYPLTYAYLCQFREVLEQRSARRKLQPRGPWYAQYNIGPYTLASWKVVWRRMETRFTAQVIGEATLPALPSRPVIPQETCSFIPATDRREALYLAAVLNSPLLHVVIQAQGAAGAKSFGSPGLMAALGLPRYDPQSPLCQELLHLYEKLLRQGGSEQDTDTAQDWTALVARLYNLDGRQAWQAVVESQELLSGVKIPGH